MESICRLISQMHRRLVNKSRAQRLATKRKQLECKNGFKIMNFELTEAQDEIVRQVRTLCANFPDEYWREHDRRAEFPHDFFAAVAAAGYLGVAIPERYGGSGLGITEAALVMREVAASGGAMAAASAFTSRSSASARWSSMAARSRSSAICRRWSAARCTSRSPSPSPTPATTSRTSRPRRAATATTTSSTAAKCSPPRRARQSGCCCSRAPRPSSKSARRPTA